MKRLSLRFRVNFGHLGSSLRERRFGESVGGHASERGERALDLRVGLGQVGLVLLFREHFLFAHTSPGVSELRDEFVHEALAVPRDPGDLLVVSFSKQVDDPEPG